MYSKEQVEQETLKYFNGDSLATNVFFKYCLRDKNDYLELTPDDTHDRLAEEFFRTEQKYPRPRSRKQIRAALDKFKYIVPQGSPMTGIGSKTPISLSNCFVIPSPEDNMSSIVDAAKNIANLSKRRGGVGLDISKLRPEGTFVNNAAKTSSGAWSFADLFSHVGRMVGQGGRRAALMITMSVKHPDVEKFVTMKLDKTKVTGANISVKITDEFMEAVMNDADFQLQWPIDDPNPKITRTVRARELWKLITKTARDSAEPGILMWDTMVKNLPAQCYEGFKSLSTNPCLPSDTWIFTDVGPRQISDLIGKQFVAIVNGQKYQSTIGGFFKTGEHLLYEIETEEGCRIRATENHRFLKVIKKTRDKLLTKWVELKDLKEGDLLNVMNHRSFSGWGGNGHFYEGWLLGMLVGDGTFDSKYAYIDIWEEDFDLKNMIDIYMIESNLNQDVFSHNKKEGKIRIGSKQLFKLAQKYGINPKEKKIGPEIETASSDFQKGFLRGFFDADGSVQGSHKKGNSIRLSQSNIGRLEVTQRMLARFGIMSRLYKGRREEGSRLLPDGSGGKREYHCQADHELVISKNNMQSFYDVISFTNYHRKNSLLKEKLESYEKSLDREGFTVKIKSIIEKTVEPVYDCTIPDIHQFDANGFVSHNCGEIILSADSCRLISQCLKWYVKNPYTDEAYFDFDHLIENTKLAMRMSDDLVDLEIEKLNQIIASTSDNSEKELFQIFLKSAIEGRRTGLGTHGLGDALIRLGLRYDSEEARPVIEKIYRTIKETAYRESINLAKERGPFPVFDWSKEKDCEFFKSFPQDILDDMAKYGRRNIAILTNAPTGSVSIQSQVDCSGLEPAFRFFMIRRRKLDFDDPTPPDFIDDLGDKWIEFKVGSHLVKEWKEITGKDETELPDYFITSEKIDWINRVRLQAILSKHIDHSISSTVNLPEDVTAEVVANIYEEAWKSGCKGMTVYRDNSRTGVLLTGNEKNQKLQYNNAPSRPEELPCDIHQVKVKGEDYTILVGLYDNRPYEVMGGKASRIEMLQEYEKGTLIKRRNKTVPSRYDLKVNGFKIKDVVATFDNPDNAVLTRMVSTSLRHGVKPSFLVEQLSRDPDASFASFSKVLARVLKKYIEDGTQVASGKEGICPDGQPHDLIYQEGCVICSKCGWTKC